jgi:hypothetical protein
MVQQSDSKILKNLVFYVDELQDDFTFYLDAVLHAEEIAELKALFAANATAEDAKKRFSLSEQITFTNLIPSKDSPRIGKTFWSRLGKTTEDPARDYLIKKLKSAAKKRKEKNLVANLRATKSLSGDDRNKLAELLVKALSPMNLSDLTNQKWVLDLDLTPDQDLFNKLKKDKNYPQLTRLVLEHAFPELAWKKPKGRALICLSHAGKNLSVTVRKVEDKVGYEPQRLTKRKQRKDYLFSVSEYCSPIYRQVFEKTDSVQNARGLLVVTGPTKSLKSEITRGLIHLYLEGNRKKNRRPHLVTFEDPIEMFYASEDLKGHRFVALASKEAAGINYTPRQKQKDAGLLRDALNDALRQTPAVFFVGETREKKEWEVLLDFAATGHLIVTTAHAGSLVEAMHKIFEAREVGTPEDRGEIANKLLAVINLRPGKIETNDPSKGTEVVFPALWRRTARGVAGLTCDGLSSLLPHRDTADEASCLGRRCLIEELVKLVERDLRRVFRPTELFETVKTRAYKRATDWDLQGV